MEGQIRSHGEWKIHPSLTSQRNVFVAAYLKVAVDQMLKEKLLRHPVELGRSIGGQRRYEAVQNGDRGRTEGICKLSHVPLDTCKAYNSSSSRASRYFPAWMYRRINA